MATVTFDGATRVNDSDSNTNWGNFNVGGQAPSSEPQLRYQYSGTGSVGAVNKKITSTTSRTGVDYDPGSGAVDMTAAANPLWFAKVYVADFGDLNATYGIELGIGSANNAYYAYNVAGTGANNSVFNTYPAQGGYLIIAINPSVAAWREATTGSPSLTAVDYFHAGAQFIAGGAKSENLALDAIDIGRGLLIDGTDGDFIDFLTTDQDTIANRWGVVKGNAPVVQSIGLLTIGDATATTFDDDTSVVLFSDGYHDAGDVGIKVDLQNASTDVAIGCTLIGLGNATTSETRPDYTVTGTSGTHDFTGTLTNFRNIVLTSAATFDGATIEFADLTQSSAVIKNSTLKTTSASGVASINDATFGTTTGINNVNFIGNSTGHAIEITSTGTYTFTGIRFSGYGANGTNSAAIYNNSGGAVTINIAGGGLVAETTYRNGSGASTTVSATFNHTLEGLEQNTEVTYVTANTSTELFHVENATTSDGNGKYKTTYTHDGTETVDILIHHIDYAPDISNIYGLALPSSDAIVKVTMFTDDNYANPA